MTKKKFLSLLVIVVVLLSFPIYSNLSNSPKNWTLKEFQNQELKWRNCYGNFECSTLLAPVNYDKNTGEVFHLKVIKYNGTDQRHKLGALVVNPGGPGASAFDYAYNAENIVCAAIRDSIDNSLLDIATLYRDVMLLQSGSTDFLINTDFLREVQEIAESTIPELTVKKLESIMKARTNLFHNAAPLLTLEALMCSLK